jgi:phenylalanyl-tRNA synthetase beta chain
MFVSLNWLKQYVEDLDSVDPQELGLKLTLSTVEVEDIFNQAMLLDNVVVGKVAKLEKHPDADRLQVVEVDVGDQEVNVVCGGSNLKKDMLVAMALPGSKVRWHGEGDLVELKPTKVRGVESFGMICAGSEIGLDSMFPAGEESEIVDLSDLKLKVGEPLAKALKMDDVIYEIDNKSLTNRPDLWGHYGMAREVAAIYDKKLKPFELKKLKVDEKILEIDVDVQDEDKCLRYMAVAMDNIVVGESPEWLKVRLQAAGVKAINNIVDISNFVLMEFGQPMHSFDSRKLEDNKIVVRTAHNGEKITTLDDEEIKLTDSMLIIADKDKPVALAGVMGGLHSGIESDTTTIVFESATFDAHNIRKTSTITGIRTESSMRFEKSLDPQVAALALQRAVELVKELLPEARVISEVVDEQSFDTDEKVIETSFDFLDKRIGHEIDHNEMVGSLERLGFTVKEKRGDLKIGIPSWRATKDVSIQEDIVEEVARMYGYDNFDPVMPNVAIDYLPENKLRQLERAIKDILAYNVGANEVYNYSFVDKKFLKKIGVPVDHVELINPWSEDLCLMRKSLLPNLLTNVEDNLRFYKNLNIFEVGKVFLLDKKGPLVSQTSKTNLPNQDLMAGGVVLLEDKEQNPFYMAKGVVETICDALSLQVSFQSFKDSQGYCHPRQCLEVIINKKSIGHVGVVHPQINKALDITQPIAFWHINLNDLLEFYPHVQKYQALAKYPSVELDLSVIVEEPVEWKDIASLVKSIDKTLIRQVDLLDVFKNGKIKAGYKSITFRTVYQSDDRTLEMEEVNKLHEKVVSQLEKAVKATVRQ